MVSQLSTELSYFESTVINNYSRSSDFEAILETDETSYSSDMSNDIAFNFEFLLNSTQEEIDILCMSLDQEAEIKVHYLFNIAHMSENITFNEILFDKVKELSANEVKAFYLKKIEEQFQYQQTINGQHFMYLPNSFISTNSLQLQPSKLAHSQVLEFLLNMYQYSKKAVDIVSCSILQTEYQKIADEYDRLIDAYMYKLVKKNTN